MIDEYNKTHGVLTEPSLQEREQGIGKRNIFLIFMKNTFCATGKDSFHQFADESAEFVCEDADFSVALTIGDILLEHSAMFYLTFSPDAHTGAYSYKQQEEEKKRKAYQDLPDIFQTKEAIAVGKRHGLSERTIKRWLKTTFFTSLSYGKYSKSQNDLVAL